jgi:tetratricopeptide (TPR) repeat protein
MKRIAVAVVIALLLSGSTLAQQTPNAAMVQRVFGRLLSAPGVVEPAGKYASWPPQVAILSAGKEDREGVRESLQLTAFAAAPDCHPIVRISQDLLDQVVQNDPDRLALILGHELGHVVLGHPVCTSEKDRTSTLELAVTRDQEYAADAKGYELALQAGFSVRNGLRGLQRMDEINHYSSFEALSVDHPSWADRIARLDKQQAPLWRSMGAFNDGATFLATENYELAASCFRSVLREFPQAADATADLGYALLMQYIDQLQDEDLRKFGIGQLATGSFYGESYHLKSQVRGVDAVLWTEAVQILQQAEQMDSKLALVKANLGLAYLVQPSGADPKLAATYLQTALQMVRGDRAMDDPNAKTAVGAVVNNYAVALQATGDINDAYNVLRLLSKGQSQVTDEQTFLQSTSLLYNIGTMLANSDDPGDRRQSAEVLDRYLRMAPPESSWWKLAYKQYAKVCSIAATGCVGESQLKSGGRAPLREVMAVDVGGGKVVRLGESAMDAAAALGNGQEIGAIPGTTMRRLRYPKYFVDLLTTDVVVAIIMNNKNSPEVQVRQLGAGSQKSALRFGMSAEQLDRILADQPYRYEGLTDTWVPYRFYPGMGIAVLVGPQKTVDELLLVRSALPSQ